MNFPRTTRIASLLAGFVLLHAADLLFAQGEEIAPRASIIEIPDHDDEITVQSGGTVLAKARVYVFSGIKLLTRVDARQGGGSGAGRPTVAIEPQYLVARTEDSNWTYYAGNVLYRVAGVSNVTGELGSGNLQNRVGGLRIRKDDEEDIEIWVRRHRGRGFFSREPFDFEAATIGAGDDLSEARELVFGGADGNQLQFVYREHAGTSPEPVLEETLSIDITDNAIVNVRGAGIEVLDADGDTLRYRVLKNFE